MSSRPLVLALPLLALQACGARPLARPPMGPHTTPVDQRIQIDQPPGPIEVEEVGPRPGDDFVWVDGQWGYQPLSQRWVWEPGSWCVPPRGAVYYAPPSITRERKATRRAVRWNPAQQRFEEVDVVDDVWRWARGVFHVRGPDGAVTPAQPTERCGGGSAVPTP